MDSQDSFLDPTSFNLVGTFDDQVKKLFMNIRLSKDQVENLYELHHDLQSSLRDIWPSCNVNLFGSIITGLGIQSSDVDCYVDLSECMRTNNTNYVLIARNILRRKSIFSNVFAIPNAKVPIVKLYHIPTDRNCDISFKSPSGVMNSKLIKTLLHMDRRALSLAIIIKYWAKVHKFTGTNFMSNYALTLLVIFYLQGKKILPSVFELQKEDRYYFIDNWNVDFSEVLYVSDNDDCLYLLLGEFFQYYTNFDFRKNLVSPFLGIPINKNLFNKLHDVPEVFALYKDNVTNGGSQPIKLDSVINIQDPFEHNRNCSAAVHVKLAMKIISEFGDAAEKFRLKKESDFLNSILVPPQEDQLPNKKKRRNLSRITKQKQLSASKAHLKQNVRHHFRAAQNEHMWRWR